MVAPGQSWLQQVDVKLTEARGNNEALAKPYILYKLMKPATYFLNLFAHLRNPTIVFHY